LGLGARRPVEPSRQVPEGLPARSLVDPILEPDESNWRAVVIARLALLEDDASVRASQHVERQHVRTADDR